MLRSTPKYSLNIAIGFLFIISGCSISGSNKQPDTTISEDPPLLSQYEEDMVRYGIEVGDWQQNQDSQDSQYYDGLQTHLQVRDYIQENLTSEQAKEYLNKVDSYIERSLEVVRDGYVLPNGGVVEDWRRFPKGLYNHYQETGDQASRDALRILRDGRSVGTGDPASHDNFAHASWIREMSYWLQAHTWGEKEDSTRDEAKMEIYISNLENHLRQIRNNDYTSPSRSGNNDYMQAFYMGLIGQALIEWYEHAGNDYWPTNNWATIPDALKDVFGWMMEQGPDGAKVVDNGFDDPNIGNPFWIEDHDNTGYGLFHSFDRSNGNSTNPYSDVSNLISPVYYWIGMHFNDPNFIELGDKVFAGAAYHQSFARDSSFGKRYGQQYMTSIQGLKWRQEYINSSHD